MGLGLSLFFVTAGAILAKAVTAMTEGIDLEIVGIIVFGLGLFGVAIWLGRWLSNLWKITQLPPSQSAHTPPSQ
jgi:hypothetical protein